MGPDRVATSHRLRDTGRRIIPALPDRAQRRPRACTFRLGSNAHHGTRARAVEPRRTRSGSLRRTLPARVVRRPAPARRRRACTRRRSAVAVTRRTVRRARSAHARKSATRVRRPHVAPRQNGDPRHARRPRSIDARATHRPHAQRSTAATRNSRTLSRLRQPASARLSRHVEARRCAVSFWHFLQLNWPELLLLVRQHIVLVFVAILVAVIIGVPTGILLTRYRALRGPVLGIANVMQTIPSLALFCVFFIPLPFIGGIGSRTALVALVVYSLLPIIRNTVTGILGVEPSVREAAVAMGMTDGQV